MSLAAFYDNRIAPVGALIGSLAEDFAYVGKLVDRKVVLLTDSCLPKPVALIAQEVFRAFPIILCNFFGSSPLKTGLWGVYLGIAIINWIKPELRIGSCTANYVLHRIFGVAAMIEFVWEQVLFVTLQDTRKKLECIAAAICTIPVFAAYFSGSANYVGGMDREVRGEDALQALQVPA